MRKGESKPMTIFTEKERKMIDAYADLQLKEHFTEEDLQDLFAKEGISEKDVKHRLKKEKVQPMRIVGLIREFVEDIERVQRYHDYVGGNYSDLHRIRKELKIEGVYFRWETMLEHWKQLADKPRLPDDVDDSISPLYDNIDQVDRDDRLEEFHKRVDTLFWILNRNQTKEIIELLQFIRDNSRVEQQNSQGVYRENKIEGKSWSWYGSRWLGKSEHQLIREHDKSGSRKAYELTDRGRVVLQTLEALYKSSTVQRRAKNKDKPISEAAKEIFAHPDRP